MPAVASAAPPPSTGSQAATTLLCRMPNYVGDAVMALPALELLASAGHRLHLLGKPWLRDLCAGTPWTITVYPRAAGERLRLLRALAARHRSIVLFTQSFSSALESRLAGLATSGYRRDFRGWLLAEGLPYDRHVHQAQAYWDLAAHVLPQAAGTAPPVRLPLSAPAIAKVDAVLQTHAVPQRFVLLCPVAGGGYEARSKNWPEFGALATALHARGITTVCAPGPGEDAVMQALLPQTTLLAGLPLDAFAALCARSALVVANDSGQGHVAAAAGARLLSLFGATRPSRVRPWSPRATVLGSFHHWPTLEQVLAACLPVLDAEAGNG